MNAIVGIVALAVVAGIGLCDIPVDGYTDFSSWDVSKILDRHNYHRARTEPSPANMLKLVRILYSMNLVL